MTWIRLSVRFSHCLAAFTITKERLWWTRRYVFQKIEKLDEKRKFCVTNQRTVFSQFTSHKNTCVTCFTWAWVWRLILTFAMKVVDVLTSHWTNTDVRRSKIWKAFLYITSFLLPLFLKRIWYKERDRRLHGIISRVSYHCYKRYKLERPF